MGEKYYLGDKSKDKGILVRSVRTSNRRKYVYKYGCLPPATRLGKRLDKNTRDTV